MFDKTMIPAQPGFYVVSVESHHTHEDYVRRIPVIAWLYVPEPRKLEELLDENSDKSRCRAYPVTVEGIELSDPGILAPDGRVYMEGGPMCGYYSSFEDFCKDHKIDPENLYL